MKKRVAWSVLASVKQEEMFPIVYSTEFSLINPITECFSQKTASEKMH